MEAQRRLVGLFVSRCLTTLSCKPPNSNEGSAESEQAREGGRERAHRQAAGWTRSFATNDWPTRRKSRRRANRAAKPMPEGRNCALGRCFHSLASGDGIIITISRQTDETSRKANGRRWRGYKVVICALVVRVQIAAHKSCEGNGGQW